ncbi:hypothetical protein [Lactococcus lactis]|uniref:hypothetical protein n=2 Tax=Streptococcaceae TaxID=1300 RepID=UPI00288FB4CD|nr:hypothetical protein [Lactococcus lactis]MDT2906114.1 hypothetical protein [Lactococcus lactis]MDT2911205.1 hypothetical protein [Lactococcus lactis]MDT2932694.1 hypothetical protein [Lactococcus lactis]
MSMLKRNENRKYLLAVQASAKKAFFIISRQSATNLLVAVPEARALKCYGPRAVSHLIKEISNEHD